MPGWRAGLIPMAFPVLPPRRSPCCSGRREAIAALGTVVCAAGSRRAGRGDVDRAGRRPAVAATWGASATAIGALVVLDGVYADLTAARIPSTNHENAASTADARAASANNTCAPPEVVKGVVGKVSAVGDAPAPTARATTPPQAERLRRP
ncbi:MAG: hypothetical protein R2695_10525 [Acidimicrobiales bacterium]